MVRIKTLVNLNRVFFLYIYLYLKGGESMAMCYVTCIVAGLRTYKQVPKFLKEQVKELLIGMDLEELVTED